MRYDLSELRSGNADLSIGERFISIVAGLFLASTSVKPRPNMFLNLLALTAGSYLAYRGATGHCPVKAALNDEPAAQPRRRLFSREV